MIDKAQVLKGLLDGCVLSIIQKDETYGYELTNDLKKAGFKELNEGSVYPVLIRLENKGYILSETKKSPLGPKRKYFRITNLGKEYIKEFKVLWSDISNVVSGIMGGDEQNE